MDARPSFATACAAGAHPPDSALELLGGDRERAWRFVERELGPLTNSSADRDERMLTTLEAFLENGQRIANASAVTGNHRDTIHRHLREVERLLGCRIERRSAELLWALRLRRALTEP